jgi:pumilio family protein 6
LISIVKKSTIKNFEQIQPFSRHSTKMPSATSAKSSMAGTKRKSAPVKNGTVKEFKKLKIESKPAIKSKAKAKPFKKVEVSSDSESDDLDSDEDGGVPLTSNNAEEVTEESEVEDIPKVADGLHPDRAKAVSTNSEYFFPSSRVHVN